MKESLRNIILRHPRSKKAYERLRASYHHVRKLSYYFSDLRSAWRFMRWDGAQQNDYWVMSSALLFQFHKLEKGFSMPNRRQVFGYDPAIATIDLVDRWRSAGYSVADPIFIGAVEALRTYSNMVALPPEWKILRSRLNSILAAFPVERSDLATPMRVDPLSSGADESFRQLMWSRRSVRAFSAEQVDPELIKKAIGVAQMAPSACNRQPWGVHVFSDRQQIQSLLALQNGNKGFGQVVPLLLIVTANSLGYFDASERWQPYVDAGLFSMSLILALQSVGLSSCCLNWCVEPEIDARAHARADIPASERIVMYIAVGHADGDLWVPRSARRALENITRFH